MRFIFRTVSFLVLWQQTKINLLNKIKNIVDRAINSNNPVKFKATIDSLKHSMSGKWAKNTEKDKTIDSLVKVQDTLSCRAVVGEGDFTRCPETGDLRNVYGYDEMNIGDKNDDHISVKSQSSTFVKFNYSLREYKSMAFNADPRKIVIESASEPSVFKITSKQATEKEEVLIRVSTKSIRTDIFAKLTVCVYKELLIEDAKY